MIVRINQFDVVHVERNGAWGAGGFHAPIDYSWPDDTFAFELLILENDEQSQPLTRNFRQSQMRHLLPEVVAAMSEPQEQIVARLDGPVAEGELLRAFAHLTAGDGRGRFAISETSKLLDDPGAASGSVRIQLTPERFAALCADMALGLERGVRIRVFSVPEEWVNPLLDISSLEDGRWRELLPHSGFVLSNVRNLEAVHLLTRRCNPAEIRKRLMERLAGGAPSASGAAAT